MHHFLRLTLLLCSLGLWAQSPPSFSYQAVVRDANNRLVQNDTLGVEIRIMKQNPNGSILLIETHQVLSNTNGLISLEVGMGNATLGGLSTISWTNGPYFLQSSIDLNGGNNYTLSQTTQLLSVPFALHANIADSLAGFDPNNAGGGNPTPETDPIFNASLAAGISGADTAYWNGKQDEIVAGSGLSWNGDTLNASLSGAESDPIFGASVAGGITSSDTAYWNDKQSKFIAGSGVSWHGDTLRSTVSGAARDFYLGQDTLGGIVFYLYWGDDGEQHGFVVSKTEAILPWQYNASSLGTSSTIDGAANTISMAGTPGATWVNSLGTGWYIPAAEELALLHQHRYFANKGLISGGNTPINLNQLYFSSTEQNASWVYVLTRTGLTTSSKTGNQRFRAIKEF